MKTQFKNGKNGKASLLIAPNSLNSRRVARSGKVFLNTLWNMVEDASTNNVISWDMNDIHRFKIHDLDEFKAKTLKKYYSAKWNSFRRQLYFYGFKGTRDTSWAHKSLDHTKPDSLHNIKRISKPRKRNYEDMLSAYQMFNQMMTQNPMHPMFQTFSPTMMNMDASNSISPPTMQVPPSLLKIAKPGKDTPKGEKISPFTENVMNFGLQSPLVMPPMMQGMVMPPNGFFQPPNVNPNDRRATMNMKLEDTPLFNILKTSAEPETVDASIPKNKKK